ncbi:MAG: alpha/beta hydrolase [Gammaproteobacteria bacterium]|nr:alpha/beta hydrolase [Gammaproteobacteria bacterium]
MLIRGCEGHYTQFEPLITCLLDSGYTVITVDPPAYIDTLGSRSCPRRFAQVLQETAKAEGTPFAVVGHSMGTVAVLLASRPGLSPS